MKPSKLVATFIFALALALVLQSSAIGQLPFLLPQSQSSYEYNTPWWDGNKAKECGRYWCSDIHLYTTYRIGGEFTLALKRDLNSDQKNEGKIILEERAKLLENSMNNGIAQIMKNHSFPQKTEPIQWKYWLFWNHQKSLHPLTPELRVGTQNNQVVIYSPPQQKLGLLQSTTILTVTPDDANVNFTTTEQLAQLWSNKLQLAASKILWGKEFDSLYPLFRWQLTLSIVFITWFLFVLMYVVQSMLSQWRRKLKHHLQVIFDKDVEADKNSGADRKSDQLKIEPKLGSEPLIRQQINLVELCKRVILILQPSILLASLAIIFGIFRNTRFLTYLFFIQSIVLPNVWILIAFIDKISDILIDYILHKWSIERQEINPKSNRYSLRVRTYSPAIKGGKHAFFIALSIYITVTILGVRIEFLASLGVLTVVLAFLSKNLLEDMLNGVLILWTDRYAIGDYVEINQLSGTVEMINLYVTHLRNLDGQLIVIPNGQVSTVINSTKDWSTSNLTIRVSGNADLTKAMELIKTVSKEMEKEDKWKDKIIESVNILGVDDISHEGISLRFLIKTMPGEQWAVARAFRWRLKQALDRAGIALGVPQQSIWYKPQDNLTFPESMNSEKLD